MASFSELRHRCLWGWSASFLFMFLALVAYLGLTGEPNVMERISLNPWFLGSLGYFLVCVIVLLPRLYDWREKVQKASDELDLRIYHTPDAGSALMEGALWFLAPLFLFIFSSLVPDEVDEFLKTGFMGQQ